MEQMTRVAKTVASLAMGMIILLIATTAATICWAWGTSYASPIGDLFRREPGWLTLGAIGAVVHLFGWLLARASMRLRRVGYASPWWHWLTVPFTGFGVGVLRAREGRREVLVTPWIELLPLPSTTEASGVQRSGSKRTGSG